MTQRGRRPDLGGLNDDIARIREFGLSKGFLPIDGAAAEPAPAPAAAAAPAPAPAPASAPTSSIVRPAPTRPWQAMFPDYLIDALRNEAAREGTAQKVIVLKALRQAGFRVDDIDLQDLRRR